MQRSSVNLDDPESVRFDDQGLSVAFFCKRNPVKVDTNLVSQLKAASARPGGGNVRLCLHDGANAPFHEMINLEYRNKYYRPHKHKVKEESYHIIEGTMGVFVFEEDGRVLDCDLLDPDNNFLYRVAVDMWHAIIPVSDVLIYHESTLGPFIRETHYVFPSWAPDGSDPDEVAAYTGGLLRLLGIS